MKNPKTISIKFDGKEVYLDNVNPKFITIMFLENGSMEGVIELPRSKIKSLISSLEKCKEVAK